MNTVNNKRGGRKPSNDIGARLLAILGAEPKLSRELAAELDCPVKAVSANLHRLKAQGIVSRVDDPEGYSLWARTTPSNGVALVEHWPMPVAFPPLPLPGTVTLHERMAS